MWFKNLLIYRLNNEFKSTLEDTEEKLKSLLLQPCGGFDMQTRGWMSPTGDDRLIFSVNRQWLIQFGVNQKILPMTVVRQVAQDRAAELELKQQHAVGRKQMRELRERVLEELMPKALSCRKALSAWVDPINQWLVIDTAAEKKADELVESLISAQVEWGIKRLETKKSPSAQMSAWLNLGEVPAPFSIDQELELKASDENHATVRYLNHPLETQEIRRHLSQGKSVTRLGLTWKNRISFVLTDLFQIKKLNFLDNLKEEIPGDTEDEEEALATQLTLMTGELNQMIQDLTIAMGEEQTPS